MCKVSFSSAARQHESRLQRSYCCHEPAEAQLTILDVFSVISYHTSANRRAWHCLANHTNCV